MAVAAPADRRFRRAPTRPARRRKPWAAAIVAVVRAGVGLAVFGGGGFLLAQQVAQAGALHVDRIVVRGNDRLSTGEVLVLLEGMRGRHLLGLDLDAWRQRLMASPWVEHASLRRVLPSRVEVAIRERQPIAIGRLGADLYLIDGLGRIIDEYGPNYAQFDLPIIDGLTAVPEEGGPLVDEARAVLANRLLAALGRDAALFRRVSQIDVANARDAVVILEHDTALVHLGDDQFLERLQAYVDLAPALRERVPDIEYVDLRFDNRVYVRPASTRSRRAGPRRTGLGR